jgi:hypothetical protein
MLRGRISGNRTDGYKGPSFLLAACILLGVFDLVVVATGDVGPDLEQLGHLAMLTGYSIYLINVVFFEYQRREAVSPLALFCWACFLYFGISGILYYDLRVFRVSENREYYGHAIIYIALFTAFFQMTYCYFRRSYWIPHRRFDRVAGGWRPGGMMLVVIGLLMVGWAARIHLIEIGAYLHAGLQRLNETDSKISYVGVLRFAEKMPDLAGWILWCHYLHCDARTHDARVGRASHTQSHWRVAAIVLIGISLLYWIPTLSKLEIVRAIIVPVIMMYLFNQKLPKVRYMVFGAIFFIGMFPVTYVLRVGQLNDLRSSGGNAYGISQVVDLFENSLKSFSHARELGADARVFGRLNEYEVVSGSIRVISTGAAELHFGSDYFNFFVNLVPRVIWPDKPSVFYGNEFGHSIGMLSPSDIGTAIAPTLIGESYLNFSDAGIFVAGLLAIIYFLFYRWSMQRLDRESGILLYATMIPTLLYVDASFALYFSGLLVSTIFIFILTRLMRLRARRYRNLSFRV